ncbi:MAG: DNA polymerase I [Oscillospiraceae bacterium]|jgi:DNA polymerase-1|nr:DNA polymerase I [Oscillospiraceae bacterium]
MPQTCLVVDGNSLMHRAFHALPEMTTSAGVPTNAVYGFLSMLFKLLADIHPDYCAVAFDVHGPTFRHADFAEYKANRKETDPSLRAQFPLLYRLLTDMGIRQLTCPAYEADDILGTLAARGEREGLRMVLVTGDRDALQLVTPATHVLYTRRGISETTDFDPATVLAQYGVTPAQVPDLKGLMGDASDNIPGVPGVGEKTATKLLNEYGTLEAALAAADTHLTGKLRERMLQGRDLALLSKKLATITRQAPLDFTWDQCRLGDLTGALPMLAELEITSLQKRLLALIPAAAGQNTSSAAVAAIPWRNEDVLNTPQAITNALQTLAPGRVAYCDDGTRITLAAEDGARFTIPLTVDLLGTGLDPQTALEALAPLFAGVALCVHDGKRLRTGLAAMGIPCAPVRDDVMLAAYLLNPLGKYALADLLPPEQAPCAAALLDLLRAQRQALADQEMLTLYESVEIPLMDVLFEMQRAGFSVDKQELIRLGASFTQNIERLTAEIYRLTGRPGFNINSPKQLGEVLFEALKLPTGKRTKSGWSTDAQTLEELADAHPVIPLILEYRHLAKLNGTYIEGLIKLIDREGRVHTWFDQTATATGRISSSEPNLQNIPVRTTLGREIRRAFIPRPGWVLVDADYSQIELRLLAVLSKDAAMTDAFLHNQDIHTRTAAEVYGVPMDQVTPAMRSAAKAVNFGIVYGISDFGLARNIGISRADASAFIERYFARYPGVRRYMDEAVTLGKTQGYSTTLLGRCRPLPELRAASHNIRSFGERAAMNTPVQGTAADVIKLAMVRVFDALRAHKMAARLILQVHDELIIECPPQEADQVSALLRDCMEHALALPVPLVADVHVGQDWYHTK